MNNTSTPINPKLLNMIDAYEMHWGDDDEKNKVLAALKQYIQHSPDFNQELVDLVEQANKDTGNEEDWMFSLIDMLRENARENKNYLLHMFKHTAQRALQNNEDDLFIYYLANDKELGNFIKQAPEAAREILPLAAKLIRVNDYLFKKVAIQTAEQCLLADPNADRDNLIVHIADGLRDTDWRIRHHAYTCLKNINALPDGYKKPFMDNFRVLFFNKKL